MLNIYIFMVLFQDAVINTGPVDSTRELKHVPSLTTTINSLGVRVNAYSPLVIKVSPQPLGTYLYATVWLFSIVEFP